MPRVSIEQFRATLLSPAPQGALVHACRELARGPGLAAGLARYEWMVWPPAAAPAPA
ncbi:MAG TPA: hypothetical protein VEX86_05530 [Longimicrobium sp.]|nr:hypothetical protein [Longimicrobium sp.]